MWAVLADNDPGDSEAAKRYEREIKVKEAAEYRQQAVAAAAAAAAIRNKATRTHGRNEKKARKNEKKAQKERSKKQRKKPKQPVTVANGDA